MTEASSALTINFMQRAGVPLLKKFALFNSGIVDLPSYIRDAALLDDLRVDSLRIDLFMGADGMPFARVVDGTADQLTYDFSKLDDLVRLLARHHVRPYWAWSYIPYPLQKDGNWRCGPTDLAAWQTMFCEFSKHYREKGLRIAYHEVYNEPDCGDAFYLGTLKDYATLYVAAARGLMSGDPDAVIGGPSSAFVDISGEDSLRTFLQEVKSANVPLDFFSHHSYGCSSRQYLKRTALVRKLLAEDENFATTEQHLNEYNALHQPFESGGPAEHSIGGATMLTSFQLLLDETDVTLAHWAQFMDTGFEPLGAVDIHGRTKAAYLAYWMYSQMSEQRVLITGLPDPMATGLHALASADPCTACVLLWNDNGDTSVCADVHMPTLPFMEGTFELYEMNDAIDPYWHTSAPITISPATTFSLCDLPSALSLEIPAGGFVLIRLISPVVKEEVPAPVGRFIRKRHYFPQRGQRSYAFFDETDQTAYLGMNGETHGDAIVATEWDHLPDTLVLCTHVGGSWQMSDPHAAFHVRVDYAVHGSYCHSVLFTATAMEAQLTPSVPWGTKAQPDEILLDTTLFTGKFPLALQNHAPNGWEGRAIITYTLHTAAPDTWAELRLVAR